MNTAGRTRYGQAMLLLGLLLLLLPPNVTGQTPNPPEPVPEKRYSEQSEANEEPCVVKARVLFVTQELDLSPANPSWKVIDTTAPFRVLEGRVGSRATAAYPNNHGTHPSNQDLPLYHYTHDFTFNIYPDTTPDRRYLNLLPWTRGSRGQDSLIRPYVHCEWEMGIGQNNPGNPAAEYNARGASFGFLTEGHTSGESFWNWPTLGDWVHTEGVWIWDRGHPPAYTELHPVNFMAIRRHIPTRIRLPDGRITWAMRVDLFASGDGSAHWNNRPEVPRFVRRQPMNRKDYHFAVEQFLQQPNPNSQLEWIELTRAADYFPVPLQITRTRGRNNRPALQFKVPWKSAGASNDFILARTYLVYWSEGNGAAPPDPAPAAAVKIRLKNLRIRKITERWPDRAEYRAFAGIGHEWFFLNERIHNSRPLRRGIGHTRKRKWQLDQEVLVFLPRNDSIRIHIGGWEADGIDRVFGDLAVDPYRPCDPEFVEVFEDRIFNFVPVGWHGCQDDPMGSAVFFLKPQNLRQGRFSRTLRSQAPPFEDQCPFARKNFDGVFEVEVEITPITLPEFDRHLRQAERTH